MLVGICVMLASAQSVLVSCAVPCCLCMCVLTALIVGVREDVLYGVKKLG
jgi:hypothetical protein